MRKILHRRYGCAFFASVEQRDHPGVERKPVIVGGETQPKRYVVSTCSYEARAFGVRSAMPTAKAMNHVHKPYSRLGDISYIKKFLPRVHEVFP